MKTTKIKKGLVLLAVVSTTASLGCELIVDFDRTRIEVPATDAAIPDGSLPDVVVPVDASDATTGDADATTEDASDASDAAADG